MIAASAVLVVVALVLLIIGVFQTGLELVFASIAASIVAALSLFFGVLKDRRQPVASPGFPAQEGAPVAGLAVTPEARPASPLDEEVPSPEEAPSLSGVTTPTALEEAPPLILPDEDEEPVAAPAPAKATRKPAAKRKPAKKPAAKKPAKKAAAKKPAAKKPAKKGAAKKPAKKAAAKKPAAKKPAAKRSPRKPTGEAR